MGTPTGDGALCCDRRNDSVYRMIGLPQTCLYTGMYAGRFTIPTFSSLQRQYLLTCIVSRYCISVPHGISFSRGCQQLTPERTLSGIGHFRDVGPALKHYWINVSCLLVYFSSDVIDPDIVCVIGQGRLSRPMVCRRCRSASLRIFTPCLWPWCQMLLRPMVRF